MVTVVTYSEDYNSDPDAGVQVDAVYNIGATLTGSGSPEDIGMDFVQIANAVHFKLISLPEVPAGQFSIDAYPGDTTKCLIRLKTDSICDRYRFEWDTDPVPSGLDGQALNFTGTIYLSDTVDDNEPHDGYLYVRAVSGGTWTKHVPVSNNNGSNAYIYQATTVTNRGSI